MRNLHIITFHMVKIFALLAFVGFAGVLPGRCQSTLRDSPPDNSTPLFSSDLIAWSGVEQARPLTEILLAELSRDNHAVGTVRFLGRVIRQQAAYFLQTSDSTSYQLEPTDAIRVLEGKSVSVQAGVDNNGTHILIQPLESADK